MIDTKDLIDLYVDELGPIKAEPAGSYSKVYVPRYGNNVVKINHDFDPTYYYLKWCMEEPEYWKPQVKSLFLLKDKRVNSGYICIMRKYIESTYRQVDTLEEQINDATKKIKDWVRKTRLSRKFGKEVQYDIEKRNIMYCTSKQRLIITDPLYYF